MASERADRWYSGDDGTRLYAVESGQGRPIILLHGGLANHVACWRFAAPLAERFHLVTPDLRGSGSSIYAGPLGWDLFADDVAALVRDLGVDRAVIGGVSFGAGAAVRTALRHPSIVSALVLLTPAFAGADVGLTAAQSAAMNAMNAAGRRAPTEGIEVLYPLFDALPADLRARALPIVATYDPASVAASTAFMASGAQPFATASELSAITAPTLLIPGTDPTHPPSVADRYRAHLPHCTSRTAEPADYASTISAFLAAP